MIVEFKQLSPRATVPTNAYEGDVGFDLAASEATIIHPGEWRDIPTGLAVNLPPGYWLEIAGRSSTYRKRNLIVFKGVVDNGYQGELFVGAYNFGNVEEYVDAGDRIAQAIFHQMNIPTWVEKTEFEPKERGLAGFGSSGM